MKINEVLEAYNKAIDTIRKNKGITGKGHFIAIEDIKKSMGPYKQFYITILYHDADKGVNYPYAGTQMMERCPSGKEESILSECELCALSNFFLHCHNKEIFDSIIDNTYERT